MGLHVILKEEPGDFLRNEVTVVIYQKDGEPFTTREIKELRKMECIRQPEPTHDDILNSLMRQIKAILDKTI